MRRLEDGKGGQRERKQEWYHKLIGRTGRSETARQRGGKSQGEAEVGGGAKSQKMECVELTMQGKRGK